MVEELFLVIHERLITTEVPHDAGMLATLRVLLANGNFQG